MKRLTVFSLCLAFTGALLFNACSKSDDSTGNGDSAKVSESAVPMVPAQYRSVNFAPVAERLDLGGTMYSFMDFGTALKDLGGQINEFLQSAQQLGGDNPSLMMASMFPIEDIIDSLGISNLAAYGASSYLEGDLYHNKSVVYMPDGVKGIFTLFGKEGREFSGLSIAPEDTDLFMETSIKASTVEDIFYSVAEQMYDDKAQADQFVQGFLSAPAGPGGPSWGEILSKTDTTATVILRLSKPVTVDTPELGELSIPGLEFSMSLKNMAWLIKDGIIPAEMMTSTEQDGMTIYREPSGELQKEDYTKDWDPAFIVKGEDLYMTNKVAYFEECLSGKSSLADSAQFKEATADFPKQGNAMMFVSKDTFNAYVELRDRMMLAEPMVGSIMPMYKLVFPLMTIEKQERSSAAIVVVDANSIFSEDRWPVAGGGVGSASGVTTVGLLAAMAIPAFQKVREQSREKAITNNLRQIASAGQQYILEEGATEVNYKKLEGDYFAPIQSVSGEDYTNLVISEMGGTLEVTTPDGLTVTFTY